MSDQTSSPRPPADSGPGPRSPTSKMFGDYEIERELGRGGMGVVYLARQLELNRQVALKMLTGHYGPEELHRFLEEAETAAGLNHNNIAHIYEVGDHDGIPFFSMEYVEGGSLADALKKELPPPKEAARLLMCVARALEVAHESGIVHRDMKPANVLLDPDGTPKVADFGIAKRLDEDSKLTRSGVVLGTPTYMAPEQAKGNSRHVGPPADVYSLGAILYEMLAGRPPFLPEDSETPITIRVLTDDPVSPAWHRPEIPRELETICMKCLQKEPHKRYKTAGEFAEDLRRYLDDEAILAKPPSTFTRTIKWVQRHPWKSVGAAAAVVIALMVIGLLVRWELYVRPHLEYATQVDWTNGSLEPITKLSVDKASRSPAYLRLTRRGRYGPIVKAETLNARGNPAVLRRTFTSEMIPFYVEGLVGAQPYSEKPPETSSLEMSFGDHGPTEAISRDRNGSVNWRLIYDQQAGPESGGKIGRARFGNLHGFDNRTMNASHIEFERDANGRNVKVTFFNADGRPATNGEGVYGYKVVRDELGRITHLVNLNADGQPMANRLNAIAYKVTRGKEIRSELRDANDQPATVNGISTFLVETDDAGNSVRASNLGPDGKLVSIDSVEWSVHEMKRNEHGELTQSTFLKADSSGNLNQVSQTNYSYDDFGHVSGIQFTGKTSWRKAYQNDVNGNVIEERLLDKNGRPVPSEYGYAIKRSTYARSAEGLRVEHTYFDEAENKAYPFSGYHRLIDEFDPNGSLRRQIMDEHNPDRYKYYRFVSEPQYDPQGRLRQTNSRFEDSNGNMVLTPDNFYKSSETVYDEKGRTITDWKLGVEPSEFGGSAVLTETVYHTNGQVKRLVRQICDDERKPLSEVPTKNAARHEEEFNDDGQRERIFETGFNESAVGFSTREAIFSGGNLQKVTHKRKDGSVVPSVRVMIIGVEPPPGQPRASELKTGDQIVAASGRVVTNSYAWVFAGDFPGGWIEVMRDGRRVRIDGFVQGPLGVFLEDRAN